MGDGLLRSLRRSFISCLLLTAVIPLLISSALVSSQSLTTVTSLQTITSSFSTYSTSTNLLPLQYAHYPDDYDQTNSSFRLTKERARVSEMLEVDTVTCGFYDYFAFKAVDSQEIRGQLNSNSDSLTFHIMGKTQFDDWAMQYWACGKPPSFANATGASYSFDWTVPKSGEYVFLFYSTSYSAGVQFSAYTVSASPVTYGATTAFTEALPVTAEVSSTTTQAAQTTAPSQGQTISFSGSIVLVALVIVSLAFLVWVTRRKLGR